MLWMVISFQGNDKRIALIMIRRKFVKHSEHFFV